MRTVASVRMAMWGLSCTNDAGIVSKSAEGLAKMMTVHVAVSEATGLTIPEKETETMLPHEHQTRHPGPRPSSLKRQHRGIGRRSSQYTYPNGATHEESADPLLEESAGPPLETNRQLCLMWAYPISVRAGIVRYDDPLRSV